MTASFVAHIAKQGALIDLLIGGILFLLNYDLLFAAKYVSVFISNAANARHPYFRYDPVVFSSHRTCGLHESVDATGLGRVWLQYEHERGSSWCVDIGNLCLNAVR